MFVIRRLCHQIVRGLGMGWHPRADKRTSTDFQPQVWQAKVIVWVDQ